MNEEKKNTDNSTIVTNRYIKEKLPSDFNVNDIGDIDLSEAEKIANEDIVLLSEQDLLIDLEDLDLTPLDEPFSEHMDIDEKDIASPVTGEQKAEGEHARDEKVVQQKAPPVFEQGSKIEKKSTVPSEDNEKQAEQESPVKESEAFIEFPDEEPVFETRETESVGTEPFNAGEENAEKQPKRDETSVQTGEKDIDQKSDEEVLGKEVSIEYFTDFIDFYEQDETVPQKQPEQEMPSPPEPEKEKPQQPETKEQIEHEQERIFEETIPGQEQAGEPEQEIQGTDDALLIEDFDDEAVQVRAKFVPERPEIISRVETVDDAELEFIDDDIDFVHTSIVQDEYINYLKHIDQYHEAGTGAVHAKAVEIFGFTLSEIEEMQDFLFQHDFKDVELDVKFEQAKTALAKTKGITGKHRDVTYIIPNRDSLVDDEKDSIESDIETGTALVYVEDLNEIKKLLGKDIEDPGGQTSSETVVSTLAEMGETELFDITDKVVIIEDELDVDRFVREFPVDKQTDIQKLLKYLDGLFEKLPRSTLKNFVDSEYFDLYIKVLTKMGL